MVKTLCTALLGCAAAAFSFQAAGEGNDGGWFTFASWNIGHQAMGRKCTPTIPPGEVDAYLRDYRDFLKPLDARVIGICEYSGEFSTNGPMRTADALFADYGIKLEGTRRGAQCNSLFLKGCMLKESFEREYPKRSQRVYYRLARVEMDGREVCFVQTHLDWDLGKDDPRRAFREDQMRTIIADMEKEKYVVVAGDFNIARRKGDTPDHAIEYDVFAEAGYTVANRGKFITFPSWSQPSREQPIDNIIVKGFEVRDVAVKASDRLSDHKLIWCRLRFAD